MKDGAGPEDPADPGGPGGPGGPAESSRLELRAAYVHFHRRLSKEVGPCRDARLLGDAARYLLAEPEPGDAFTVFRFYHAVSRGLDAPAADARKYLLAFVRAAELLETLCVNLFLQPWKKEIRSLKVEALSLLVCSFPFDV